MSYQIAFTDKALEGIEKLKKSAAYDLIAIRHKNSYFLRPDILYETAYC